MQIEDKRGTASDNFFAAIQYKLLIYKFLFLFFG